MHIFLVGSEVVGNLFDAFGQYGDLYFCGASIGIVDLIFLRYPILNFIVQHLLRVTFYLFFSIRPNYSMVAGPLQCSRAGQEAGLALSVSSSATFKGCAGYPIIFPGVGKTLV